MTTENEKERMQELYYSLMTGEDDTRIEVEAPKLQTLFYVLSGSLCLNLLLLILLIVLTVATPMI